MFRVTFPRQDKGLNAWSVLELVRLEQLYLVRQSAKVLAGAKRNRELDRRLPGELPLNLCELRGLSSDLPCERLLTRQIWRNSG